MSKTEKDKEISLLFLTYCGVASLFCCFSGVISGDCRESTPELVGNPTKEQYDPLQ